MPHYASAAIAEIKPDWKFSGPVLYTDMSVQQISKFTIINYITIYNIYTCSNISYVLRPDGVPSSQEQRKVLGLL